MSEENVKYIIDNAPSLESFKGLDCVQLYSDPLYKPPTPAQIDDLIKAAGWSQSDTAKLVGVSYSAGKGSGTIRKWRAPVESKEHRSIPYAAWRLLLINAGVV